MDVSQENVPSILRAVTSHMPGRKLGVRTSPLYSPPLIEWLLLVFSVSVTSDKKDPWEKPAGIIYLWIIGCPGAMLQQVLLSYVSGSAVSHMLMHLSSQA